MVDINIVIDVLLDRKPHVNASVNVWHAIEERRATGMLVAHAVTTIHYLETLSLPLPPKKRPAISS